MRLLRPGEKDDFSNPRRAFDIVFWLPRLLRRKEGGGAVLRHSAHEDAGLFCLAGFRVLRDAGDGISFLGWLMG